MSLPVSALMGLALVASASCAESVPQPADTLWERGVAFEVFLDEARAREETWRANWARAEVAPEILERARAVPGTWRLLAVAEDWCGDSANTIPYLARLAAEVEGIELRIVDSDAGEAVMEAHRTPDGRTATPTVVLLDESGRELGCWVERPSELQRWWIDNPEGLDDRTKLDRKYAWYDEDAGATTIREVVEMIEAAAAGGRVCEVGEPAG